MKRMKIAILGFGKEGRATLRFLKRMPKYRRAAITVLDKKHGPRYLDGLEKFDLIVKTPGIPWTLPQLVRAQRKHAMVTSATALFFAHAKGKIIGITGTKGKGTTATLLWRMLRASGENAYIAGNIGKPMLDIVPHLTKHSSIVLELSSFQLQNLAYSPHVAVVLDIFPDHLDAHKNYAEYVEAKAGIVKNQKRGDSVFFFDLNHESARIAAKSRGKKIPVNAGGFALFNAEDMQVPGRHNFMNAVMAGTVALSLGCEPAAVRKVATSFRGLPLRLELVREVGGVRFYNDSASTNPYATAAAVRAFEAPCVLIAGGKDKGFSYAPLGAVLRKSSVRLAVLMGENTEKMVRALKKSGVELSRTRDLAHALGTASAYIREHRKPSEHWAVIFSPGAASFDMFADYKERGSIFNALVKKVTL